MNGFAEGSLGDAAEYVGALGQGGVDEEGGDDVRGSVAEDGAGGDADVDVAKGTSAHVAERDTDDVGAM
jgi:hypothetical protein